MAADGSLPADITAQAEPAWGHILKILVTALPRPDFLPEIEAIAARA